MEIDEREVIFIKGGMTRDEYTLSDEIKAMIAMMVRGWTKVDANERERG